MSPHLPCPPRRPGPLALLLTLSLALLTLVALPAQAEADTAHLRPQMLALSVGDLDASVAWYGDIFAFREVKRYDFPDDEMRLAFLERDGFELELIEIAGTPPFDAPDPGNPATRRGMVKAAFHSDDIEALYRHAVGAGARVQSELAVSRRTGGRFFILLDPDGNWIQVYGPASEAGASESAAPPPEPAALDEGFAPSAGLDLYFHSYGEGPPLLLLNGGPGVSSQHFPPLAKQVSALGEGHRVILFDQRGTARSPLDRVDATTVTLDLMLRDVEALREHLGYDDWVVMGHSWGGMYAMAYATRHPGRVRKLILSASGGSTLEWMDTIGANLRRAMGPDNAALYDHWSDPAHAAANPEAANRKRVEAMAPAYVHHDEHVPFVVEALTAPGANFPEVRGLVYADLRRIGYDLSQALAAFTKPTLILHGRQDPLDPEVPQRTHAALPNSELVWIDECSHYLWLDQPEEYFSTIEAFLTKDSPPPS